MQILYTVIRSLANYDTKGRQISGDTNIGLASKPSTLSSQSHNTTSVITADEYLPYQSILSKYSNKYSKPPAEG